jgi:hypothetical protein
MLQRCYRRLLDRRNEIGESRLPVWACLRGWARGWENYKETGFGVRIMVYKLAQRHTFDARKQTVLVVPSFKYTLGACGFDKFGLGNATIEKDSVLLIDLGSFVSVPKKAVSYIQITSNYIP